MTYLALKEQLVDTLAPYTDMPSAWVERHGAAVRELAQSKGARLLVAAVRRAAAAGPRRLDFFEQDSERWLNEAEIEQRQAPPPAPTPTACPACGSPMTLRWCRECGSEAGATAEEIDEARRAWLLERRDPAATRAARESVLADFHKSLPWNRGTS